MEEIKKQYPLLAILQLNSSGQGPVIGYANYKDTADINRYLSYAGNPSQNFRRIFV